MNWLWLKAAILGIIEGLTEFIPVSSTGHLIIGSSLLNLSGDKIEVFTIVIQSGAILAICWYYYRRLCWLISSAHKDAAARNLIIQIIIGSFPAAIFGVLCSKWLKYALFNSTVVAFNLVVGGLLILYIEKRNHPPHAQEITDLTWKDALKVGFAQCLALFPGVSRSGATIMGGLYFGLSRKAATEFSFFMAIPIILGASVFDLISSYSVLEISDMDWFLIGTFTSFISGLFVIRSLLKYIATHTFIPFAWYRIALGMIILVSHYLFGSNLFVAS